MKRTSIPHPSDTIVLGEKKSASPHYYMDLLEPGSSSDFPGRVLGNDDTELEQGPTRGGGAGHPFRRVGLCYGRRQRALHTILARARTAEPVVRTGRRPLKPHLRANALNSPGQTDVDGRLAPLPQPFLLQSLKHDY
jgi:hypothetical protein